MEQNGAELLEGREINWERNQEEEEKKGQPCQTLEVQAGAELGSLTQTVGGGGGGRSKGWEGKTGGRVKRRMNQRA